MVMGVIAVAINIFNQLPAISMSDKQITKKRIRAKSAKS
jgi:hypothetical protein